MTAAHKFGGSPQSEHARLAGSIAAFWGSATVETPQGGLARDSFALGVTIHDRGYGPIDALGIGEVDEATWLATQAHGVEAVCTNPIADTVALMHGRRLVSGRDTEERRALADRADTRIQANIARIASDGASSPGNLDREAFERADTVTAICDMISFRVCFEEASSFAQSVWAGNRRMEIVVRVDGTGGVTLAPWPLAIPELNTVLLGYRESGYPENLDPVLGRVQVIPG